jgi:hypothetical protein
MTSQDKTPDAQAPRTIAIDSSVALNETAAKAQADEAYYRNRCLLLAQQVFLHEKTIEAQKTEIERLTALLGEAADQKTTEMEQAKTSPMKDVLLSADGKTPDTKKKAN